MKEITQADVRLDEMVDFLLMVVVVVIFINVVVDDDNAVTCMSVEPFGSGCGVAHNSQPTTGLFGAILRTASMRSFFAKILRGLEFCPPVPSSIGTSLEGTRPLPLLDMVTTAQGLLPSNRSPFGKRPAAGRVGRQIHGASLTPVEEGLRRLTAVSRSRSCVLSLRPRLSGPLPRTRVG